MPDDQLPYISQLLTTQLKPRPSPVETQAQQIAEHQAEIKRLFELAEVVEQAGSAYSCATASRRTRNCMQRSNTTPPICNISSLRSEFCRQTISVPSSAWRRRNKALGTCYGVVFTEAVTKGQLAPWQRLSLQVFDRRRAEHVISNGGV